MEIVVLENENCRVIISPLAGASMRSLRVKPKTISSIDSASNPSSMPRRTSSSLAEWYELLTGGNDPHDPKVLPQGNGSFIMAPWTNRLRYGILHAHGYEYQLPINREPHAIHGFVRDREWEVIIATDSKVELTTKLDKPWPFNGSIHYQISITGDSLIQSLTIEAEDGQPPFPAGFGWHPWFRMNIGTGSAMVQVPGQKNVWEVDNEFSATGKQLEPESRTDLRHGMWIESMGIDQCMQIIPGSPTIVQWPNAVTLTIISSPELETLHVFAPERSICVEPETSTINAFRLDNEGYPNTGTEQIKVGFPLTGWTKWSW